MKIKFFFSQSLNFPSNHGRKKLFSIHNRVRWEASLLAKKRKGKKMEQNYKFSNACTFPCNLWCNIFSTWLDGLGFMYWTFLSTPVAKLYVNVYWNSLHNGEGRDELKKFRRSGRIMYYATNILSLKRYWNFRFLHRGFFKFIDPLPSLFADGTLPSIVRKSMKM